MTQQTQKNASTGTSNEEYNLISVLYHALENAATCEVYIEDAEEADDQELVQFFQKVKEQSDNCAEQAKQLLAQRIK